MGVQRKAIGSRLWLVALAAATLALLAAACGGGGEEGPKATPAARATPAASPAGTPAAATVSGAIDVEMGDNFFTFQGKKKPNIEVKAGEQVTVNLVNKGQAIHNLRIAGLDGKYDSADDFISQPEIMKAGDKGTLKFKLDKAGNYKFRCDFHPDESTGTIKVAQ